MIGGHLDIAIASGQLSTGQINIEVPARVEYRFIDSMSIHFETGLVLGLIGDDGPATAPPLGGPIRVSSRWGLGSSVALRVMSSMLEGRLSGAIL